METITEAPDESSNNSSQVKSENGSPHNEGGRGSPPPNCAICLGRCRNKSFTDSCLHQFCFKCLLTWSRVKTECPLCKQTFKSIIHNVKSNDQYEEYPVGPHDITEELVNAARRFRYRTTLTIPRRDTLAIQQFLLHYPLALVDVPRGRAGRRAPDHRRSAADFRCTVYRHNLWARPLPDFTGRFRDCSPEFFRYNDSQVHRLIPWLNRELHYLLNENVAHIAYVLERILELLPRHGITSAEFRAAVYCYFGERTDHFLHEFHCFASTPYDLTGYDRHVQYATDARAPVVNEVLSSSDSDTNDSDIVMVSSSHPAPAAAAPAPPAPAPGPSHTPAPVYPRTYIPQPAVIPIETISHSDSDSSEVMVVGYIKPPHQRTPELVDLLNSDSDVVVQEAGEAAGEPVRLTLSRARRLATPAPRSESGDEPYAPPPRRRRRAPPAPDSDSCLTATPPFSSATDSYEDSTDGSSSSAGERTRRARRKAKRRARQSTRPRRKRFSRRRKKVSAETPDTREETRDGNEEASDGRNGTRDGSEEASDRSEEASDGTRVRSEEASDKCVEVSDRSEEASGRRKELPNGKDKSRSRTDKSRSRTDESRDRREVTRDRIEELSDRREESTDARKALPDRKEASPDLRCESRDRRDESRTRRDESRDKKADTRKGKSKNGKGVKSSVLELSEIPLPPEPWTHGEAGPSGARAHAPGKRKLAPGADSRHKRLKSVVSVIQRGSESSADGAPDRPRRSPSASSSDDNIPLHLTLSRNKQRPDLTSRTYMT